MNDEMREAYQNIFGREWESELILLRESDSAQQSGFQAAYQLQQAKIEELEKELESHFNPPEFRQLPHEH